MAIASLPCTDLLPVAIIPAEGMNLAIVRQHGEQIDVTPAQPLHQWFGGVFTDLPTDREMTINILMDGKGLNDNHFAAQVWKWVGLRPLMTYADPARYESYEWFRKNDAGRWISGNFLKSDAERDAGNGLTPRQDVIPAALASEFLSEDGDYWQPWREIATVEAFPDRQVFTIHHQFSRPTATIAIHVPYTYSYQQAFLAQLRAACVPGVFVDDIGVTREGRALRVVRIEDPDDPTPLTLDHAEPYIAGGTSYQCRIDPVASAARARKKVHLVIARTHATEQTGSWVVQGLIRRLTDGTAEAAKLRKDTTWLVVLIFDPDGSANCIMNELSYRFFTHRGHLVYGDETPAEVVAYASYLRAFVNSGRPIYTVTSFYCLECNEADTVCCPHTTPTDNALVVEFMTSWFKHLRTLGIHGGQPLPWAVSRRAIDRLHGWCSYFYGTPAFTFEVNDRFPTNRLTMSRVEIIGSDYAGAIVAFTQGESGQQRMQATRNFLHEREEQMELWYRTSMGGTREAPSLYDLLAVGF